MTALAFLASAALHVLAQIAVTVSAPSRVAATDPVLVQVEVTAPVGRDVRVVPPNFAPFHVVTTSVVSAVESSTGPRGTSAWQTVEHRYVLSAPPAASGHYDFPAFEAHVSAPGMRDAVGRSGRSSLDVQRPPGGEGGVPAIVDRAHVDTKTGINFHALATPDTVYVGQQATYQVGVFLDEAVRARLRRNPEFLPPELRGMLAYELPAGRSSLRDREIAGKKWDVHVFQRAVFPLAPGRTDVPPAQLSYSLPLSLGFFSREESYTARSEPATVVAISPPTTGRPTDWVGAVGVLHATARIDSAAGRVGDPLVLTLRVEGTGNVKLLPRPRFALDWGTAVDGEERVTVDSTTLLVRGAKEFDWIITPRQPGDHEVPGVRYPYFDPYDRRYDVATAAPIQVHVAPGTLASTTADGDRGAPALDIRPVDDGAIAAPVTTRVTFWLLALLAPLPAAYLLVRGRPRRVVRPRAPTRVLRELTTTRDGDVRTVRRAFSAALAERLALRRAETPVVSARSGLLSRRLRRCGVTEEAASQVEALVHALDAAAYAAAASGEPTMNGDSARRLATDALALYARVDAEARPRLALLAAAGGRRRLPRRAGHARLVALFAIALGAAGAARAAGRAPDDFGAGVQAYEARRYADAARLFSGVARAEVRSPDAWANAGTAAWQAGDTIGATIGWQRALRLDPRAQDMRVRLELLPAAQDGWIAGVPPVPVDWAALGGLALWLGACAAAATRLSGRAPGVPLLAIGVGALAASAASAALTAQLQRVQSASRLAVVRGAGALHAAPTFGGETHGLVEPTDVARVLGRRAGWTRIALDGGRDGWVEADRLVALDATR